MEQLLIDEIQEGIPNLFIDFQEEGYGWRFLNESTEEWVYCYEYKGGEGYFPSPLAALCHFTKVMVSLYLKDDGLML